ncbi:MAG: hypothetical protein WCG47_16085, partial [Dermatophilaceae bacterium]
LTRAQMRQAMTHTHLRAPFGRYHGIPVQGQPGDAAICIAPQQAGKTTRLAIGRVADAPGACLVTSTKADIVDATIYVRHNTAAADTRRVWVFDPDEVAGWPAECRWDIVAGCDDPAEAMRRAAAMTAAKPLGRGGNAEFFADACRTVLRCLLHAAALTPEGSMREVMGWVRNFADDTPFIILREDPQAEPGWVEDLTKYTRGAAPETVASTEMSLNSVVSQLEPTAGAGAGLPAAGAGVRRRRVRRAGAGHHLLPERRRGGRVHGPAGDRVRGCDRVGRETRQPAPADRRLDPILTLVLDEAPNVAPLPDMQALLTDGGGRSARCRSARRCCSTAPPCGRRSRCRRGGNARTRSASGTRSSRRVR